MTMSMWTEDCSDHPLDAGFYGTPRAYLALLQNTIAEERRMAAGAARGGNLRRNCLASARDAYTQLRALRNFNSPRLPR